MGQVAVCDRPWWYTWGRWQCVTGHGGTHGAGGSVQCVTGHGGTHGAGGSVRQAMVVHMGQVAVWSV